MRILIVNTDYVEFIAGLYADRPGLDAKPYAEQMAARFDTLFGLADFYSRNLTELGHEAETIIANNDVAQHAWARENGMRVRALRANDAATLARPALVTRAARVAARLLGRRGIPFNAAILAEQIRRFRPDVLINQAVDGVPASFIERVKPHVRLMVGQHAAVMPDDRFDVYDLMLSSLPNFVDDFRRMGLRSELHPFAFEPRILDRLPPVQPTIAASFVGTFSRTHDARMALLEYLGENIDLQLWGVDPVGVAARSRVRERYHGPAFGLEMYRILRRSKTTVNFHSNIAGEYANNMRLFEATGAGTLLVTDAKKNLPEYFAPEAEVVTFRGKEECRERIEHYLEHEPERAAIARAGQQRTLRDHNYAVRMAELVETLKTYL